MHTYRVAQRLLSIDPALPELALRRVEDLAPPSRETVIRQPIVGESVFHGDGQLGASRRHIDCRWTPQGYSLKVDGVGHFRITDDGRSISRSEGLEKAETLPPQLTETVLGPAMTLALALQGVWCLHAGAVEHDGEVVAFLGPSGAGKSTLARELPRIDRRLRCAADDVLPVMLEGEDLRALPQFPQLKYRVDQQPGDALPASLPVRRICVLEPQDAEAAFFVEPLTGPAAVVALVRHTVAARLFTKLLLKRHMDFCVHLAARVQISRLSYPHRPASLEQTQQLLFPQHRNVALDVDPLD